MTIERYTQNIERVERYRDQGLVALIPPLTDDEYVCRDCGAIVDDTVEHDRLHEEHAARDNPSQLRFRVVPVFALP